ncbi:unnamed protein product [Closterium sp. NIES-65]|nr:unnamed protein product [Closterium sp. NIES-65]
MRQVLEMIFVSFKSVSAAASHPLHTPLCACVSAVFAAVVPCRCVPPALRSKDTATAMPRGGASLKVSKGTAAVMPRDGEEVLLREEVLCEMVLCEMVLCEMVLCEMVLCEMVLCEMVLCEMALCEMALCEMALCEMALCETKGTAAVMPRDGASQRGAARVSILTLWLAMAVR